jgi:hypothetical protein
VKPKDEAAKFLANAAQRKRRADRTRDCSPALKKSAAAALAAAELAGKMDWTLATEEDVRKLLILSKQELEMLNAITHGTPPRNAQAILAGIRLKLEYSMKKPQAEVADDKKPVNVTITMLGTPTAAPTEQVPHPPVGAVKKELPQ